MKNRVNKEERILGTLAFAVYSFALTACVVTAYSLVTAYIKLTPSIYFTSSHF